MPHARSLELKKPVPWQELDMDAVLRLAQPMYDLLGWSAERKEEALSRPACGRWHPRRYRSFLLRSKLPT